LFASATLGLLSTIIQTYSFISKDDPGFYWLGIAMTVCLAAFWFFSISGRLFDLRVSRVWILAYAALWALSLFAIERRSPHELMAVLLLSVVTQLPLMVLPSRRVPGVPPLANPPQ
jgi:hypothetical protein